MATITMDTSEYEVLIAYRKQLESSLEKERELGEEIQKLNKEKIEALEAARMKVVKVTEDVSRQYVAKKRMPSEIFYKLERIINGNSRFPGGEQYLQYLQDTFFEIVTVSSPKTTYTNFVGLDEFRDELRESLKGELDEDVKNKLKDYEFYNKKVSSLLEESKELNEKIVKLEGSISTLETLCKEYRENEEKLLKEIKQYEESNTEAVEKLSKIKDILKDGYDYFYGKSKLLDKIISVLKEK